MNPGALCAGHQTIDDGLRTVACRKHAAIGFGVQHHALLCKPGHGVGCKKLVKRFFKKPLAAWVALHHVGNAKAGMGNVAAAAAAYFYFLQQFTCFFEQCYAQLPPVGSSLNGGKKAGSPAAHHHHIVIGFIHPAKIAVRRML